MALVLLVGVLSLGLQWARQYNRRSHLEAIRTGDGEPAKRSAWWIADFSRHEYGPQLRDALKRPDISDDFLESLIYTLGRLGDQDSVPALQEQLRTARGGFVRQATWLALARCDTAAFRAAVESAGSASDWDSLGIALGRLHLGEQSAVHELARWARVDNVEIKMIASRSLARMARPLLETAGCWPADFDPQPRDVWPIERVDQVEQRAAEVDLARIKADGAQHQEANRWVRKNVRRLASGRDWIARVLFWRGRATDVTARLDPAQDR